MNMVGRREKTVAFIDIGTNAIRLLLARFHPNLTYTILSQQKEIVRLGEDAFDDDTLRPAAMQRALEVCKQFRSMAHSNDAQEIVAVATSATREAVNKDEFVSLLRRQAQLNVHTVSGMEEARLIYLGVANSYDLRGRTALFVDIGGGSTELIVGDQDNYQMLDSLKLGAIRLGSALFARHDSGPVKPRHYKVVRQYVLNSAIRSLQKLKDYKFDMAVGSSGTVETLASMAAYKFLGRPRRKDDPLTLEQLSGLVKHLCSLTLEERAKVPGMNLRRADIIIPGAAILETLMEELGIPEMYISDNSMQHGLMVDYMLKHGYLQRQEGESFRLENVRRLARKLQVDMAHAEKVRALSVAMFDSAKRAGLHELDEQHRELMEYAAILHDVGIFLSYSNHEAHSYYLVKNSALEGFDQDELQTIASLAYFHRKRFPQNKHPEFKAVPASQRKAVREMSILLRMAESLDRSHTGVVQNALLRRRGQNALLEVICSQSADLEMWGMDAHAKSFERIFNTPLTTKMVLRT